MIANRISYDRNKNQDIQVIAYLVALNLGFLEFLLSFFFLFFAPSVFDAFLLNMLRCCLMDDDLEFCLVMELIMFVPLRKNGFS